MRLLKAILLRLGPQIALFLRALARPHAADCLLVPPASPGSMGDEAMLRGSLKALRLQNARRVALLCCIVGDRGVPVMCCEYQDKVEGMLMYFDQADMVIRPAEFAVPDKLADRIVAAVNARNTLKTTIQATLPHILELARGNVH